VTDLRTMQNDAAGLNLFGIGFVMGKDTGILLRRKKGK
jgi:hypothetical protein